MMSQRLAFARTDEVSFMKRRVLSIWLAPTCLMLATAQAAPPQHNKPLRPISKCLDAGNINEWHIINDTTLTARNGPRYYVIKTAHKCQYLGKYGASINFRPSHGKMGAWRICGDIGETVSSRNQPPCAIQSVKLIDKKRFEAINRHAERNGNGAGQPTLPPRRH